MSLDSDKSLAGTAATELSPPTLRLLPRLTALLNHPSARPPYLLWTLILTGWLSLGVILGSWGTIMFLLYMLFTPRHSAPPVARPQPRMMSVSLPISAAAHDA